MAKQYDVLSEELADFIRRQKMFFVATAAPTGYINLSPKGMDSFRVVDEKRVAWLNLTGSGNETAAHLLESNRMTIMFCAFEGKPLILRLYGSAKIYHPGDAEWDTQANQFPDHAGARQIFEVEIDMVQTSCGFAVPFFDYQGDRDVLQKWAEHKGEDGIREYWAEKNQLSLDGKPTGMKVSENSK